MRPYAAVLIVVCAVYSALGGSYSASAETASTKDGPISATPVLVITPKPEEKPPETLKFRRPVLFVLVLGGTDDVRARVAVAMAKVLGEAVSINVVPQPTWGVKEYIDECRMDPSAAGAFIVEPPGFGSREIDSLIALRNIATVQFNAMISTCPNFYEQHNVSPAPTSGPPEITWVARTSTGEYGRTFVQFLPFAVLTSVYLAFAPQRVYQTTTTHTNPAPNPVPSGGYNSSTVTQYSNTLNASGTGTLQNTVVSSVGAAALDFGQKGDPNQLTLRAAEAAAFDFTKAYRHYCEGGTSREPEEELPGQNGSATPQPLPHNDIDEATFCAWLHPFIAGKITYVDRFDKSREPANGVTITLTPPSPYIEETTQTDCLGTYHFTTLRTSKDSPAHTLVPGGTYTIEVKATVTAGPAERKVTVTARGERSRQIADFSVTGPVAAPCPTPSPTSTPHT